jgi:hypothetical protein
MTMSTSLKDRFREVDAIPSPWDDRTVIAAQQAAPIRPGTRRGFVGASAGVAAAIAVALVVVLNQGGAAPTGDASWLTTDQGSCVERYSPRTLENRSYAFEGVITDVQGSADPNGPDPGLSTTTVTFDVDRWFWGGTDARTSRRTYAFASSAGDLDGSIGARLLVSGDEDFIWACGFTQPATDQGRAEFEAAAAGRNT